MKDIIIPLIFFLVTIPVTILINLKTQNIKDWLSKRSIKKANTRIDQISSELETFSRYINKPSALVSYCFAQLFILLFWFFACMSLFMYYHYFLDSVRINIVTDFLKLFSFLALYILAFVSMNIASKIRKVLYFDDYEKKSRKRISKLENIINSK